MPAPFKDFQISISYNEPPCADFLFFPLLNFCCTASIYFHTKCVLNIKLIDLKIRINSQDKDLMNIANKIFNPQMLEVNIMLLNYYRYKLGVDGVCGRNLNFTLKIWEKVHFNIYSDNFM